MLLKILFIKRKNQNNKFWIDEPIGRFPFLNSVNYRVLQFSSAFKVAAYQTTSTILKYYSWSSWLGWMGLQQLQQLKWPKLTSIKMPCNRKPKWLQEPVCVFRCWTLCFGNYAFAEIVILFGFNILYYINCSYLLGFRPRRKTVLSLLSSCI